MSLNIIYEDKELIVCEKASRRAIPRGQIDGSGYDQQTKDVSV